MAKTKGIRITFTPDELRDYYAYLGSQVGAIQDGAAIRDQRPSAYAERVAALRYTRLCPTNRSCPTGRESAQREILGGRRKMTDRKDRHLLDRSRIKDYPRKRLKPSDLGYDVTICIAAMTMKGSLEYMVSTCDSMLSFGGGTLTADGLAYKRQSLSRDWNVMIAGDVSEASIIVDKARDQSMASIEVFRDKRFAANEIRQLVVEAYRARVNERIQNEILSPYGLTLGSSFNPQEHPDIRSRIDWLITRDFDCQLLVYGYDCSKDLPYVDAHIFSVHAPGDVSSHQIPGFWAIGSGADLALSSLAFSGQNHVNSNLEATIWNVCVAKFRAERAHGVGPETELIITSPERPTTHYVDGGLIDELRERWKELEEANTEVPDNVREYVKNDMPKPDYLKGETLKEYGLE